MNQTQQQCADCTGTDGGDSHPTNIQPDRPMPRSFQRVLEAEGLSHWVVKESPAGGYCWLSQKKIEVPKFNDHGTFLHEVAHALREQVVDFPTGNDKHDAYWGNIFSRLVTKYTIMMRLPAVSRQ